MKYLFYGYFLILLGLVACQKKQEDPNVDLPYCSNITKSKELAKTLIIGKWNWLKTTYYHWGGERSIETPLSIGKTLVFEFTENQASIFENGILIEQTPYEIKYWGEGTNTVDEIVTIYFEKSSGRSMLSISENASCLTLVNSYDDAGGDSLFEKVK